MASNVKVPIRKSTNYLMQYIKITQARCKVYDFSVSIDDKESLFQSFAFLHISSNKQRNFIDFSTFWWVLIVEGCKAIIAYGLLISKVMLTVSLEMSRKRSKVISL